MTTNQTKAPAQKAYEEATAQAWKAYKEAVKLYLDTQEALRRVK